MPNKSINQDTVFNNNWPVFMELLKAAVTQDEKVIRKLLGAQGDAVAPTTRVIK